MSELPFSLANLIPAPKLLEVGKGEFTIDRGTYFEAPESLVFCLEELKAAMRARLQPAPLWNDAAPEGGISGRVILKEDDEYAAEEFCITVKPDAVTVCGGRAGVFYGVRLLQQIMLLDIEHPFQESSFCIPCCRIEDAPRFSWRGFMLDSSRHFQSVACIKRLIDLLAAYRINRFHWHLMDGNGFRVFLERYPALTEFDASCWNDAGFYTPDDIREIAEYARIRHIRVYPEVEIPGHSGEVLKVFPEFACPVEAGERGSQEYCLGNPDAEQFLTDIVKDIAGIFEEADTVHLGGDEANPENWEKCPHCCQLRERLNCKDFGEVEHHCMLNFAGQVAAMGRTPMVWASNRQYPENVLVQAWHPGEAEFSVRHGNRVVNSNHLGTYLDYPQNTSEDKFEWMPMLPLRKVYEFDPVPEGLTADEAKLIIGSEACLWTEKVPQEKLFGKVFPRLCALAEVLWSPLPRLPFHDFQSRVKIHQNTLLLEGAFVRNAGSGRKRVSIGDIADAAGVSKTAVSIFINGKAREVKLALATCARIATTIRTNQYEPNIHARSISGAGNCVFTFFMPRENLREDMLEAVAGAASVLNRATSRMNVNMYDGVWLENNSELNVSAADGYIQFLDPFGVGAGEEFSRPCLRVALPATGFEGWVEPGYSGISAAAARMLAKNGIKEVAILSFGESRYQCCLREFRECFREIGGEIIECGSVQELNAAASREDVAFFFDGNRALHQLHRCLAANGVEIEGRVILGCADRKLAREVSPPPVVFDFDWQTLGEEAARMLDNAGKNGSSGSARVVVPAVMLNK